MDDWEEAAEVTNKIANPKSAFDDEEEDDVPDNWDEDEVNEEKKKEEEAQQAKKKALKQKLKEKEEEEKRIALEQQANALDPRGRERRVVEESDFQNAQDLFGGGALKEGGNTFETRRLQTKEDFEEMSKYISAHLRKNERSLYFTSFVRNLTRDLCLGLKADDVKEVQNIVTVLLNDKLKEQREASKGKKKQSKKPQAQLDVFGLNPEKRGQAAVGGNDNDDFGDDDFM